MRLLFLGDVVGQGGCEFLMKKLPDYKRKNNIDVCIANGENSAQGNGVTPKSCEMVFSSGVDFITLGNHTFKRPEIMEYLDKFINLDLSSKIYHSHRAPRLFYLWGHSYEFDNNNNWDVIETFSEKIGSHKDIWYATNIEIFDYIQAYNSVRYNLSYTIAENPSSTDVWINKNGKIYKLAAGCTTKI